MSVVQAQAVMLPPAYVLHTVSCAGTGSDACTCVCTNMSLASTHAAVGVSWYLNASLQGMPKDLQKCHVECRQDSASVEAQLELQADADRWRQESVQSAESLRESQVARDQAQEQVERLQGSLRDLQRHAQDRSSYDELQERFKEVSDQWFASH